MPTLSRRTLIASLPLGLSTDGEVAEARPDPDPLHAEILAWSETHAAREAMLNAYAGVEGRLFRKARALGLSVTQAMRSPLAEATALKALNRDIRSADRKLDRAAAGIARHSPQTPEAALAQIDMGLTIQGPHDWDDHAYALIQSGRFYLWRVLARS